MNKFTIWIFMATLFFQCSKESENTAASSRLNEIKDSFSVVATALVHQIQTLEGNKNICISPFSIEAALMMTMNGAEGNTQKEMKEILNLEKFSLDEINASYKELEEELESSNPVVIHISNGIFWDSNKLSIHSSFSENLNQYYLTDQHSLDFNAPNAENAINLWVKDVTNDRIEKVLDNILPEEILFILNAVYLKADWNLPFHEDATVVRTFTKSNGQVLQVPTMSQDNVFNFYMDEQFEAVELPFSNPDFSMSFILPSSESSIPALLKDFHEDKNMMQGLFAEQLKKERILLLLPKFKLKYRKELKPVLSNLGMKMAFQSSQAEFSKIGQAAGNIYVTRVLHDTFLEVDEKGVEGAAVTTVGIGTTSIPPVLDINRPFMFLIRHIPTQSVLFMGVIENPLESS